MDFIYVLINGDSWEDMVIFLTEAEAIQATITYSNIRVEIFAKHDDFGYTPSFNYYQHGILKSCLHE